MGVHPSGDGVAWDSLEAIDVDQPHGKDYIAWQHLSKAVRKRIMQEHSEFADATVGGIHKPGGCAILGMEITDDAGDPTALVVADGTYRGHGLVWGYEVETGANKGILWCATAAAGASTTGDWTVMKLHPDLQWGGGDVTWAGTHQFDASVTISADTTLEILGDLSVAGTALFDGSVVLTADATLEILGDLSVAGYALFDGSVVITADATLEILGDMDVTGKVDIIVGCTSQSNGAVDMTSETCWRVGTAGMFHVHFTNTAANGLGKVKIGDTTDPDKEYISGHATDAKGHTVTAPVPKDYYIEISETNVTVNKALWSAFGKGSCVSV